LGKNDPFLHLVRKSNYKKGIVPRRRGVRGDPTPPGTVRKEERS
jgi:hypothetical protein